MVGYMSAMSDICLPCQIYVCHVRYMSAMSDIYPTIPIYKMSFCLIIQIWLDICLPCQIYVSPLLNNSDLYVQRISGMSDIYRVCQPYIWYVRYISRLARIYLVCQIYIASGTHIYISARHISCLVDIYRDMADMCHVCRIYIGTATLCVALHPSICILRRRLSLVLNYHKGKCYHCL